MARYQASFNVLITVFFDDNGEDDRTDQAFEIAEHSFSLTDEEARYDGIELVGKVALATPPEKAEK